MTSPVIPTGRSQEIMSLRGTAEPSVRPQALSFARGELIEARVIHCGPDQKVTIRVKNSTLLAETGTSFQTGEKLTLRVDQLTPNIVLRIMNRENVNTGIENAFVKFYRANPGALKDLFVSAETVFHPDHLREASHYLSNRNIDAVRRALDQLMFFKSGSSGAISPQDYIKTLGLNFEKNLMKALHDPTLLKNENAEPSLKETLLRLSEEIHTAPSCKDLVDPKAKLNIDRLAGFADQALTVIESLQIVNILAQEQDKLFVLQIPVQCADGIRMQDIYIEAERDQKGTQERTSRVVLFLDMDSLGDLIVDASFAGGRLSGIIKSQNENVLDFISNLLPELKEKMREAGYNVCDFQCIPDRNLQAWKSDFLTNYDLYSRNTVDVSI